MPRIVQEAIVRTAFRTNPTVREFLRNATGIAETEPIDIGLSPVDAASMPDEVRAGMGQDFGSNGMGPEEFFRRLKTGQFDGVLDGA